MCRCQTSEFKVHNWTHFNHNRKFADVLICHQALPCWLNTISLEVVITIFVSFYFNLHILQKIFQIFWINKYWCFFSASNWLLWMLPSRVSWEITAQSYTIKSAALVVCNGGYNFMCPDDLFYHFILFCSLWCDASYYFPAAFSQYSAALSLYFDSNTDRLLIWGLCLPGTPSAGHWKHRDTSYCVMQTLRQLST